MDQKTFTQLAQHLDYQMLVVTAQNAEGPAGCLVGFSTQCSIHPPRYLVCLSDKNRTERIAETADALGVHFLDKASLGLARLFGGETTDETDTFSRVAWHPGPLDVPLLDDCGRWFVGKILEHRPLGDHVCFVLEPLAASSEGSTDGLFFQQVKDLEPGHKP